MEPCAHRLHYAVPFPFVLLGLLLFARAAGTLPLLLLSGRDDRFRYWWRRRARCTHQLVDFARGGGGSSRLRFARVPLWV
ncbi:hypothetical protein ALC57_06288 [Trachymyrmex cornetzi]|uniref:Uncharacterized protein n=1 Tax=Trachymyrmex cornetzi TaxID=471704 RepID=A0A195E961_9HYME|nr:hypothetical protein ALC57_06288 [Trachymyrmex cornetzi]